jgi:hypothetical protein
MRRGTVPEVDFMALCDYAQGDHGKLYIVGAGIDTVTVASLPAQVNVAVALRLTFTRGEVGRPHRVELLLQDEDGGRVLDLNGTVTPAAVPNLPAGWPVGAQVAFNLNVPIRQAGLYSIELLVDGASKKSVPLRVQVSAPPTAAPPRSA